MVGIPTPQAVNAGMGRTPSGVDKAISDRIKAIVQATTAAKDSAAGWSDTSNQQYIGNGRYAPAPPISSVTPSAPSQSLPVESFAPSSPWVPYSGPSGDAMAQTQYKDQYALLDKMGRDSTKAYAAAGNQMGGIYDALAKSMSGQTAGIKKQYSDSGTSIGNNYNNAISQTNASYDKSRSALEQMAANLGIQQGLPGAESSGYDQQNFLGGLMRANQANDTSYNTNRGNNEVSYNTRNAQIEKNMGAGARFDFKQRGLAALSGLNDKRLSVKSNQSQSANDYAMKIAQMNSDSKSAWNTNETNRTKAWNTDQTNKAAQAVAAGRLKLDSENAAAKANAPADNSKLNAYELLAVNANTAYNGNSRDAQRAIKIIQDLYDGGWGGDKNWTSSSDFYNDVARSNPAAASSQLSQLANMFYAKMAGGAGKPFNGGTGRISWTDANGT